MPDHKLSYNSKYGVFSENGLCRLDLDEQKMLTSSSHDSWATRLVFKRLNDGGDVIDASGPIYSEHKVGIFSEDGKVRLDIGTRSMKRNAPADQNSNTSRLVIKRLDGSNSGQVHYGHVVGIYSEDGRYRLDLGGNGMKETASSSHNSWATRLQVIDLNPTGLVNGVYWCGRDLAGLAVLGNHHFVLIVDNAENMRYMGLNAQNEDGVLFATMGATKADDDRLIVKFNEANDVKAVREHIDPGEHTSWWKPDLDFEGKLVKCNPDFTRRTALRAVWYSRRPISSLPKYSVVDENCSAWVNTLFKVMGIDKNRRHELGEMNGIDWGEEDEISVSLFDDPSSQS